jgi:hypothetical protein
VWGVGEIITGRGLKKHTLRRSCLTSAFPTENPTLHEEKPTTLNSFLVVVLWAFLELPANDRFVSNLLYAYPPVITMLQYSVPYFKQK